MSEPESLATHEALSRHLTRRATDQLIMLSDKVFAIAITLAAIEIHVPSAPTFSAAIAEMNVALLAYVMSFVVIAVFRTSNRELFARLQRLDRPLTALVLGTLCLTALIPASVRVSVPGEGALGGAFQLYALLMGLSGTLNVLLWLYASIRPGLMPGQVSRNCRIRHVVETGTLPLLFAVIFLMPTVTTLRWIAVLLLAVLMLRRFLLRGFFAEPESPPCLEEDQAGQ